MRPAEAAVSERVVRVGRVTACANGEIDVMLESARCGSCAGGCGLACGLKAVQGLPAGGHRVGDRVQIFVDRLPVRRALIHAFGVPLTGLLVGAAAADHWLAEQPAATGGGEGVIIGAAGVGFIVGVLIARWLLRRAGDCRVVVARAAGGVEPSLTGAPN